MRTPGATNYQFEFICESSRIPNGEKNYIKFTDDQEYAPVSLILDFFLPYFLNIAYILKDKVCQ